MTHTVLVETPGTNAGSANSDNLADRQGYPVDIGRGIASLAVSRIPSTASKAYVIFPEGLTREGTQLAEAVSASGITVVTRGLPEGEASKTRDEVSTMWDELARNGFNRNDVVIAVGGGATTDVGGFVAATYLRGIGVIHVPTSLVGMVDAAIGGKTAINIASGKNLVGAFHSPLGVVCDLAYLDTLPSPEFTSGFAELIKHGFIEDVEMLSIAQADHALGDPAVLEDLVVRAVRVKARVVSADPKESSLREILNYGHTLAHAIEKASHFTWRHGDAVSVGMMYAARLGVLAGITSDDVPATQEKILSAWGLPTTYSDAHWPEIAPAMRIDKKTRGGVLRFVVLEGFGRPVRLENPSDDMLQEAFVSIGGTL
jgi:3-dehydroquinate synthase